ncbi:MAG: SpoIIE family protein phosphatase [Candidatus Omnitrophica bacterium]|nr:SpoIIE family protein phosphatase [Candidatus Omnitrophota bacterium]
MAYQHIDIQSAQSSKHEGAPCGDAFFFKRTPYHTTLILADGVGSGIKAHVAAQMNVSRLSELLEGGATLRDAFFSVAGTMSAWRDHTMPFSAFLLARVLNDGTATVLSYEMPPVVLFKKQEAMLIEGEPLVVPAGLAHEAHFSLKPEDGLLLMSDGITQAGLGKGFISGWGAHGVSNFMLHWRDQKGPIDALSQAVLDQATLYDGNESGDDRTTVFMYCRLGQVVDVLTGPPSERSLDAGIVDMFLREDCFKVICGATTADIVSRHARRDLEVEQRPVSFSTPPRYYMQGVDIVTEGAITLMQAYNILEEDLKASGDRSAASDLAHIFQMADWVRFTVGLARNPANTDIVYRKQGILPRDKIIPLLAEKLERMGKLVTVQYA